MASHAITHMKYDIRNIITGRHGWLPIARHAMEPYQERRHALHVSIREAPTYSDTAASECSI